MRLDRAKADEVCQKIMEKYESLIPTDNYGKTIQEVYDMERLVPRQEYLDQYYRMKDELNKMGVEFPY
jgi:hypothetical protein